PNGGVIFQEFLLDLCIFFGGIFRPLFFQFDEEGVGAVAALPLEGGYGIFQKFRVIGVCFELWFEFIFKIIAIENIIFNAFKSLVHRLFCMLILGFKLLVVFDIVIGDVVQRLIYFSGFGFVEFFLGEKFGGNRSVR